MGLLVCADDRREDNHEGRRNSALEFVLQSIGPRAFNSTLSFALLMNLVRDRPGNIFPCSTRRFWDRKAAPG
jgi:hypothetical protein